MRPASLSKKTMVQVFSCEFYEISKNIFSYRTPPVAPSRCWLFLQKSFIVDVGMIMRWSIFPKYKRVYIYILIKRDVKQCLRSRTMWYENVNRIPAVTFIIFLIKFPIVHSHSLLWNNKVGRSIRFSASVSRDLFLYILYSYLKLFRKLFLEKPEVQLVPYQRSMMELFTLFSH